MIYYMAKYNPTKQVEWWEYECPECSETNVLPNPPFPSTHHCRECGRHWDIKRLVKADYVALCGDTIPA